MKDIYFPYERVRDIQDQMISDVMETIKAKSSLIMHAPTGLGKTVATLSPALSYAINKDLTIFFLTSRHTQHHIAIKTLKEIKKKHNLKFTVVDIIGKQWMCPIDDIEKLYSNEFNEYCKLQREEHKCEFYENTKKKTGALTVKAKQIISELKQEIKHTEELVEACKKEKLCPYEIATQIGKEAKVIVADYYNIFHETIRQNFLGRIEKSLANAIIIIDEGHNLPKRCRDILTVKLTSFMLERAIKEAKKFGYDETREYLEGINSILINYSKEMESEEIIIEKNDFISKIKEIEEYEKLTADLEFMGDEVREMQKQSYIGSIAAFLTAWQGEDTGYARILTIKSGKYPAIILTYKCLDPSILTKNVIDNAYATIIMSGTLTPTFMYKDILGFKDAEEKQYQNPFPKSNRLNLIVPETTTKFTKRNEEQYRNIAKVLKRLTNNIEGNCAIYFPSYDLRDRINYFFSKINKRKTLEERQGLTKQEKQELLEEFKKNKDKGAILLGVASGSFGEGIDLIGDFLKAVIIVGLPLEKPNLETKELINYYDQKFGKGWDYGYIMPAITKILQNAGRCIRSETDKGVIVFLDERYAWPNYRRCFPIEMECKITRQYEVIKEFFNK